MKKLLTILTLVLLLLMACAAEDVQKAEAEPEKPYKLYTEVDEDGCEYIIVYEKEIERYQYGGGIGIGITAKVNQPENCIVGEVE